MSRLDKIRALLNSPFDGEREAAQAALARAGDDHDERPIEGTPEWQIALNEWVAKLNFCSANLGSPCLSNEEIALVRNWTKSRGDPWLPGARDLLKIHEKLRKQHV
jgi:hypothetical protein